MLRGLYTDPAAPSAFSSLHKLQQAAAKVNRQKIKNSENANSDKGMARDAKCINAA